VLCLLLLKLSVATHMQNVTSKARRP